MDWLQYSNNDKQKQQAWVYESVPPNPQKTERKHRGIAQWGHKNPGAKKETQQLTTREVIKEISYQGKPAHTVFLDVTKAYDKAWLDAIMYVSDALIPYDRSGRCMPGFQLGGYILACKNSTVSPKHSFVIRNWKQLSEQFGKSRTNIDFINKQNIAFKRTCSACVILGAMSVLVLSFRLKDRIHTQSNSICC